MSEVLSASSFDELYARFCHRLKEQGQVDDLTRLFMSQSTDEDRCRVLLSCSCIQDISLPDNKLTKSSSLASKYKSEGNKNFQNKKYMPAWESYSKSIRFAEQDSKDTSQLALAYANRSATLFYLERWEACLEDIRHAMESSYPARLLYKLFSRKGHCLQSLGRYDEAIAAFQQSIETLDQSELDNKKKTSTKKDAEIEIKKCKTVSKRKTDSKPKNNSNVLYNFDKKRPTFTNGHSNEQYQSLSDACGVDFQPDKGRFLVAKRDIFPGEVVLIEKPFASVLLPEHEHHYCHHCFKPSVSLIPCQLCPEVMFCSLSCSRASWDSYHKFECGLVVSLKQSGVGKFGMLALRTVFKMGIRISSYKEDILNGTYSETDSDCLQMGCNKHGLYLSDEYHAIHCLVTHDKDRHPHDLFRRGVMAIFLVRYLQKSSIMTPSFDEAFVGGLLLSHLQSFPCNAHEISELVLDTEAVATSEALELGAGIYATLSLFNHSCDPAVNRNFYGETCIVRAIKTIHKGQEISDNYGAVYPVQTKLERIEKLKPQYYFNCFCQPCVEDWPQYHAINNSRPNWRCESCGTDVGHGTGKTVCPKCQVEQDLDSKRAALNLSVEKYGEAFESLLSCDIDKAQSSLEVVLKLIQRLVVLPWRDFNNCQEALKQCYSIKANCHFAGKVMSEIKK